MPRSPSPAFFPRHESHRGGSYGGPFAHQGMGQPSHQSINPAMLASYNQPQQQPSQYGGVSPAQLLNGMANSNHMQQQQQHNQQQMMMMNGAGLNPSALSAAANSGMSSGGGGGMNSFMNGGGPGMSAPMNPQMQQPQLQLTPQMIQMLAHAGVTREQLAGMNPAERQTALREAMITMRQRQIQNQQAQQQHFLPDQGSYERPGSAMGMGMGAGSPMAMGSGEYQQPPNSQGPPQNGFQPKLAPPHFGPGPNLGTPQHGMQQQPLLQQQNSAQNSFVTPGSPFNRSAQSLPPSDPQPQVLRSNSMGPPSHMMRSSSASGSHPNGLPQSNGGTPQPHRQPPQFGPQAHTPQRQSSIPRSVSPVKRAPSTPVHPDAVSSIPPAVPPPSALPAPSTAPGPLPAAVPSLPPLPASVNLNPAVTRVTVVPLATSLTTIPPIDPDEVKEIKEWMEVDRKYETVYRDMKVRMGTEHRELMGPRHIPWWEKGTLDMNASRFLQAREKFEVRYPYRKRDPNSRRKPPKREGLKLPRKPDPEDANRHEELVPIRLEFDVDHHKVRDTFSADVGPEHFAQTVIEDYNLAPSYHAVIVKAIQDQLSDYRAHSPNYDGDSWNVVRTTDTLRQGTLEGESAEWWCNWRKRLRTEYGLARAERNKRRKLRKVTKDEPENEQPMSVEEFTVNSTTLREDMRILIRLDIIVGSIKLDDQFEWDLDNEDASPEEFAEIYTQELGLGGEFSDGELERHEKERDKDFNKRRKKGRGGRRGVALPDREPIRTCRTPAIGFPEPDPATLAAAAAASAPVSRRAAAAAASVTIANLVASENAPEPGDSSPQPMYRTSSLPALPLPPPPPMLKEKTAKGFFKPPPYDTSILRPRARVPAPIPSTAADVSKLPAPLENDPPPPPSASAVVIPDNRAPRAVTAKRAKELERSAKEKEFAEGQQQNMINGVWHCSNCGCPDSLAIGRRKGPLGDKSQCGTCGKYWHRYRKPRPVEYNSDYEFHANGGKKEVEVPKRKKGRPPNSTAAPTPADTSEPQTPRDSGEDAACAEAQDQPYTFHTPPPAPASVSAPTPSQSPVVVPASVPLPVSVSSPPPAAASAVVPPLTPTNASSAPPTSASPAPPSSTPSAPAPPPIPAVPLPPRPTQPPEWLSNAMQALQARYRDDRFEVLPKATAVEWEWRLKCLDCPGKVRENFFPLCIVISISQPSTLRSWNGLAHIINAVYLHFFTLTSLYHSANVMAGIPFRILHHLSLRHSFSQATPSLPKTFIARSPSGFRFYTAQRAPPKVPTRPGHDAAHTESAQARPVVAAVGQTSQHAEERIDGSTAFQPQPFNVPGSPIFGGNSLRDAALTTVVGLMMVFVGGVAYVRWYKWNVLRKIESAFSAGYDPALELATYQNKALEKGTEETSIDQLDEDGPWTKHLRRKEQDWIDAIVQGREPGHYFVLLGPKGSGKGTMIFDAMAACEADGVAMLDAHPDLEVFRLKLGKAINYEYNEDSQTGLFQRRGPALDIERAMNKLEKVALKVAQRRGKPLVLIINNVHFFKNDDEGRGHATPTATTRRGLGSQRCVFGTRMALTSLRLTCAGIVTCVFMTDDFWPFYVMRKTASRMQASVLSIYDLDNKEAMHATTRMALSMKKKNISSSVIQEAIGMVGGRLSYLNKVARAKDMIEMANQLLSVEKAWLCSQIGLIPDLDDDVMDEQKWSSCSWLLLQEFVRLRKEQERVRDEAIAAGKLDKNDLDLPLPKIPLCEWQIMTRPDFLEDLDRANIVAIDVQHDVRPDSMLILHAARQVVEEDDFEEILDNVRSRIDEIESLHRTRELTFKDVESGDKIRLSVDKGGRSWF
ncbi:hypothetical protein MVEN_02649300 [Mycena venus]|uniref:AAA protein C-terminal winged helix domain-containing protein n=1 Tax=Mycena venus TaxID=2733690 RepID=A0A8H6TX58_9AGAR|nr:hypothetical protein MVEN_02649300 [Mycena venus]